MEDMDAPTEISEQQPEPAQEQAAAETTPEEPDSPEAGAAKPAIEDRVEEMSRAMQKVTQVLSHLSKKVERGGELSKVEQAKLDTANEEATRLRQQLDSYVKTGDTGDPQQGVDMVAAKSIQAVIARQDALEAENKALKQKLAANEPTIDDQWKKLEAEVPNAKSVWKEASLKAIATPALKSAQQELEAGEISQASFDKILRSAASQLFHEKANAIKKAKSLPVAGSALPNPPRSARSAPMPGVQPAASVTNNNPVAQAALERLSY